MNMLSIQQLIGDVINDKANNLNNFMSLMKTNYNDLSSKQLHAHLVSEANYIMRNQYKSCDQFGVRIKEGDICYIDFGQAYLNEAGFQHFGLITNITNGKVFVIPMTSNPSTYHQAYDEIKLPNGKKHLMQIGLIKGLNRDSVLFLNDCKYINSARIIDVKANIDTSSELYKNIQKRILECLIHV